jgi:general secretion pathway protein C
MTPAPKNLLIGAAVLAAVSVAGAWGVNQIVAGFLALPDGAEVNETAVASAEEPDDAERAPSRGATTRTLSKRSYIEPIVKRNIFDPDAVGVEPVKTGPVGADRATDLDLILLATVVAVPDTFSSALIAEDKRGGEALGYGIGDDLIGEGTILRIEQKRVIIKRNNGDIEYLAVDDDKKVTRKPAASAAKSDQEEGGDEGIEKVGDNKWEVDRSLVEEQIANVEKLATQIRVVPHKDTNGDIDGYRLSGIRRGSLFDKLGIKNGDIVHGVNGMALTSADGALKAYQALQSESGFSFDLTRRNQKQTFEYEIR